MPQPSHELEELIRREIAATGPLSFARFMELALYHPVHGYYQGPTEQIGCQGDFYTSVSVGNLFGQLLAFQFAEWLEHLLCSSQVQRIVGEQASVHLVEAGAHNGGLASDILSWLQRERPELLKQVEYYILEPSSSRRQAQAKLLQPWGSQVRWCEGWEDCPLTSIRGVIFSNELLDALPVYRLGWDSRTERWFEWRVSWVDRKFAWCRSSSIPSRELETELQSGSWQRLPSELRALLPDGFTIELSPAARAWWTSVAARLAQGKLLTLDYGLEEHDFLAPHRSNGTLRSYKSHHLTNNPLAQPGEQDLTAHVNFSALIQAGESVGLKTDSLCSQASFLTLIARRALSELPRFGTWSTGETRQFQTLTHPNQLGCSFSALLQSR